MFIAPWRRGMVSSQTENLKGTNIKANPQSWREHAKFFLEDKVSCMASSEPTEGLCVCIRERFCVQNHSWNWIWNGLAGYSTAVYSCALPRVLSISHVHFWIWIAQCPNLYHSVFEYFLIIYVLLSNDIYSVILYCYFNTVFPQL